jgi:hypothetical protein
MKGTMSEMELTILRQRAHEALKQKARGRLEPEQETQTIHRREASGQIQTKESGGLRVSQRA